MEAVRVNGVDLAYVEYGTGPTIVFVHGLPNDYRVWRGQVDSFPSYHVVAYSRRCSYPNKYQGDARDDSVANNAADLAAFIEEMKWVPVHLVGHSYGGFISLLCAHNHPELVRSMVLCEPAVTSLLVKDPGSILSVVSGTLGNPSGALALRAFANTTVRPAQRLSSVGDPKKSVEVFVDGLVGRAGAFAGLDPFYQEMMQDNASVLAGALSSEIPPFTKRDAKTVVTPTLLMGGDRSPRYFGAIIDVLYGTMPSRERTTIPGSSHFVPIEKSDEFNRASLSFLAKQV